MSTESIIPEHVFISYSHLDRKFCSRLINDLQQEGVDVWIDHIGLEPGTPSWNKAIRDAISRSFAVLLLASPHSEQSDVVQGELSLARSYGCPIYPLWIGGKWEESVPLNMIQAQRIDLREERYQSGVVEILEELKKAIERRAVKHFPIKVSGGGARFYHPRVPRGYLSVAIGLRDAVAMRLDSYPSLQALLDDLYMGYLTKKYKPFSYGKEWIITSWVSQVRRLLVPWNWLIENGSYFGDPPVREGRNDHQPLFRSNPSWQLRSLEAYGLAEDTHWGIIDRFPIRAFGVVTNDPSEGEYLLHRAAHADYWGKINAYFDMMLADHVGLGQEVVLAEEVNLEDYKFSAVFATDYLKNGIAYIIDPSARSS